MIELVFVIVILGVLAAVAVPRFVTTRTDAQVAMLRSDIASVMKAIPARIFAENIDPTQSKPTGFSNWGEWMIDTGGLDRGRWSAMMIGNQSGIAPIDISSGTLCVSQNQPGVVYLNVASGNLHFNPETISNATGGTVQSKPLCNALKASYPSGSNRIIPLATTGAVKF